jgi:hypothetical protein
LGVWLAGAPRFYAQPEKAKYGVTNGIYINIRSFKNPGET